MSVVKLKVNERPVNVDVPPDTPLLYVLRNQLELNGPMFGCGLGQCGACAVIINGEVVRSCITPVAAVEGTEVITLEGLGTAEEPHAIQQAFIDEQAVQCGYCINGMIMTAKVLVDKNQNPTDGDIREALQHNLCRCAMYLRVIHAVKRYAQELRS